MLNRRSLISAALATWLSATRTAIAATPGTIIPARNRGGSPDQFAPPPGRMLLTRLLERDLGQGQTLSVARTYAIRFAAWGDGYRVEGIQQTVKVIAPPKLAALAALEQQRAEPGLFPIVLNPGGQISEPATPARASLAGASPTSGLAGAPRASGGPTCSAIPAIPT